MDEMTLIEQVFAEPKPDAEVAAAGRARLLEAAGAAEPPPLRRPGTRALRRPGTRALRRPGTRALRMRGAGLLPVAAAGTAVALTAGALAMVTGDGSGRAPVPPEFQARRVLLAAATKSAAASAKGRYYTFATERGRTETIGRPDHRFKVMRRSVSQDWYALAPGGTGWSTWQDVGARPLTPADDAAWRAAGSPAQVPVCSTPSRGPRPGRIGGPEADGPKKPDVCELISMRPVPGRGWPMVSEPGAWRQAPRGLDIPRLSHDPATLRGQLLAWTRADGLMGPVEGDSAQLWAAAMYIIASSIGPVPAGLRAATYRVLADLPDVRSLGTVTDRRGRRGEALTRIGRESEGVGPGTNRLVIDPRTGAPLESSSTGKDSEDYDLILTCGYTDEAPPSR
ncbi:hypothetical protein [Actinomadura rupiterrae]|uniref:hypothetical protein n=1 Tax=Actinomadura rupiterrae TaxID=559627 RepID=UPI0020A47E55|nr:hypothetical protein [Actinomadura rupiterrae]MCP2342364.1 hypothetical protein [Actinomadura rupiterrae]